MANLERNSSRKIRGQLFKQRIPKLGYYFIVTDTKETEQNYMFGLRNSIPPELQDMYGMNNKWVFNIMYFLPHSK